MKLCILFLLVFGGSSLADSRFITEQDLSDFVRLKIYRYFDRVTQRIVDAGLDPLEIDRAEYKNAIVPGLVEVSASVDNLSVLHLSKISVDSVGYIHSIRRLAIDLSQAWTNPLNITVGNAEVELNIFNNQYKVELSGNVIVDGVVLASLVDFNFDNGISVSNVVINFYPGTIQPTLSVKAFGNDYSEAVNKFLEYTLVDFIYDNRPTLSVKAFGNDYSEAVNKFLEYTLVDFIYDNRDQIDGILAPLAKIILNALLRR